MEPFLIVFLVVLVAVTIALMVLFYYLRKGYKFIRKVMGVEMSDEEFERRSNKYYDKNQNTGPQFDDDYFKGRGGQRDRQKGRTQTSAGADRTARTTRTGDGLTIVDHRDPSKVNKKIFSKDEGEYVDYVEN